MLPNELTKLVEEVVSSKCERQDVEVKRAAGGTPERLYDTLSAFANQIGGGVILFGIDERDDFAITGVYDAQDLQAKVASQALQMEPPVRPVFTVADIEGRTVVSAEIAECDPAEKPCFYRGSGRVRGSYVRVGESDFPMTEYEVYNYAVFRRKIQDELRVVERADRDSFDSNALAEYFVKLRRTKPNLASQPDEKILQLQGFVDQGRPTVAGIVVLGEYPQAYFPQLSVVATVVDGTQIGDVGPSGERFIDNRRIEGTLGQMLEATLAFVRRNTRCATIVDESGARADRSEYPQTAVREAVLNALVHRDYSAHTDGSPIRVMLFDDRLEIESPGGLYGRTTIEGLGKEAGDTRNPFIAGAMEVLGETENRFSGIPTIANELRRAGLPPAVFESRRGTFRVTFFNGRGLPGAGDADGLSERARGIVEFCARPRSRQEIAEHLGIGSRGYVMSKHIRPLLDQGLLRMTIPEAPRSKNQRYVAADAAAER